MSLFCFFKTPIIEFYCNAELFDVANPPVPASKMIPDWFKKTPPFMTSGHRHTSGAKPSTAKRCMPLLDAMTAGWVIPLWADVNVRTNETGALIEVGTTPIGDVIQFHDKEQLGGKSSPTYPGPAVKFINHWVVKTAPGYSTLFMPPLNHMEPRFTCLSGLVDTDKYPKEVNFPAVWHAKGYDGVVFAGTPLVTCIPVKRSDLNVNVTPRMMREDERQTIMNLRKRQDTRSSVYTKELREPRK